MSIEQEILRVEREYWQLGDPGALAKRLAAFEQSLAASWMYSSGATPAPTPNTTITGHVAGCSGQNYPGVTVLIQDAGTLATLDTVTTDSSGNYSSTIFLAVNTSCKITATVTGTYAARWNSASITSTIAFGTTNTGRDLTLTAATGYVCFSGCHDPIPRALTMVDSVYGTFTTPDFVGPPTGVIVASVNYAAGGTCAAQTGVGVDYTLANSGSLSISYNSFEPLNVCPKSGAVSTSTSVTSITRTSLQCDPFQAVFSVTSVLWGGTLGAPATATITWKE